MSFIQKLFRKRIQKGNLEASVTCPKCRIIFQWKNAKRTSREVPWGSDASFHQEITRCPNCDSVALYSMPDIDGWEWDDSFKAANPSCEFPPHYVYDWGIR